MRRLVSWLIAMLALAAAAAPAHAEWYEAKSKHFVIYSDDRPDRLREFAERLERFDQAVRRVRAMDDPALTDSQRLKIYVLPNNYAVGRLAGQDGIAGLYRARASGAVAFVPRRAGSRSFWDLDSETIFFHEYAHHLQLHQGAVPLPTWLIEGFAEFFATAQVRDDGSVVIGNPPQYRAWSIFNEDRLSVRQMVGVTYDRLTSLQWDALYGRGWLLTHYLTFEPRRRGQLERYAAGIFKGMSALQSAEAAFGDLRTLENELVRYKTSKLHGIVIDARRLSIGPIAIRPLRAGEAAMMNVHIRSSRGAKDKAAARIAADARTAAALHSSDPFVQAVLAKAEHDAGNHAAAQAAADRALAADPKNVQALIYKGRARMELARAAPDRADWTEIRSWFLKANRLDTENAEPLVLFYQAYARAGRPPTPNAIAGLVYAVALAPHDDELRITAVRQLLVENRLSEAKTAFEPLAAQPHTEDDWRDVSGKIMKAMTGGDGTTALAQLNVMEALVRKEADEG